MAHNAFYCCFEELEIGAVVDALFEWDVQTVVLALALPNRIDVACPREKLFSVLMEAHSHYSACQVKRLLHSITMVHVDIYVQHPRVNFKHFENAQNYVVDVAESTSLAFFGVVQAASPVDGHISLAGHDRPRTIYGSPCRKLTEIIQSIERRTIRRVPHLILLPKSHFR
jgi:hypothetical protein